MKSHSASSSSRAHTSWIMLSVVHTRDERGAGPAATREGGMSDVVCFAARGVERTEAAQETGVGNPMRRSLGP